jgi:hypothetical protein
MNYNRTTPYWETLKWNIDLYTDFLRNYGNPNYWFLDNPDGFMTGEHTTNVGWQKVRDARMELIKERIRKIREQEFSPNKENQ